MLFNSLQFAVFFPVVTLLFFLLPHRFRWLMLLTASCYFYMAFIPVYILILGVTIVVDYIAGILIENAKGRKRWMYLLLSIIANVGFLAFFKYANFIGSNINGLAAFIGWNYSVGLLDIILPIGLSFHTFQAMSYTIEVYRGNQKAERHFGIYALYVMFYPQLVAGPIERPQNLLPQFHTKQKFNYEDVRYGLIQMLWGLFKKIVIADRLSVYVDQVFDHSAEYSGLPLIIATAMFAFQIFCDFSGYSDIAIGAARVMGFRLMKNFNAPYISRSVKEFWQRWHISLSTWFRDYVFYPLSFTKTKSVKWTWVKATLIVFMISGLWHGAKWTFVIWGALHGVFIISGFLLDKFKKKTNRFLRWKKTSILMRIYDAIFVFVLVGFAWVFFRASSVQKAISIIKGMFNWKEGWDKIDVLDNKLELWLCLIFVVIMEIIHALQQKSSVVEVVSKRPLAVRWALYTIFAWMILVFGEFGNKQFIYFQF